MPLEQPDLHHLNAAQGFTVLGMYEDANDELERIDPFCRALPEVLKVRVEIYRRTEKWELMQVVAESLARYDLNDYSWNIDWAYATRRAVSIKAAKAILLNAVKRFRQEALIHFNLACYDCQLGDIESAKIYLRRALELQPDCRAMALDDSDLEPLWELVAHSDLING